MHSSEIDYIVVFERTSVFPKRAIGSGLLFGCPVMNSEKHGDLATRLRECADIVGSGDALSRKSAIPRSTLESYLTGESEPKASRLAAIARAAGVSLDWLVFGDEPTSTKETGPISGPEHSETDRRLMGRLVEKMLAVYKEMGIAIPIHQVGELAARAHDQIVSKITDPDERLTEVGEVAASLRQELRTAAVDPASSKRRA